MRWKREGVRKRAYWIEEEANAKALRNPVRRARTGPQRGGESRRFRATEQRPFQHPLLAGAEAMRPSGSGLGAQGFLPLPPGGGLPAAHAATIHAYSLCDFDRAEPLLQQSQRPVSALLQLLRTAVRSHAGSIGHYLCRNQ